LITDTGAMVSGVRRPSSALASAEVCVAAAMADVAAAVCLMLRFVPLGGLSIVLAAFPFALLGDRYHFRVCLAAAVSGSVTGFLLAGPVTANAVSVAALLGSLVGIAHRRVWSWARTLAAAAVLLGLPAAALAVTGMWALSAYRQLAFAQVLSSWAGLARIVGQIPAPVVRPLVHAGDVAVTWVIGYWWVCLLAAVVGAVVFLSACARALFRAPLGMVSRLAPSAADLRPPPDPPGARVAPLPLRFTQVGVGYPGRAGPVLSALDFSLDRGEFVAVTGLNGAGKSTLARLIAGALPDSGHVSRPGEPGLGASGGTAMIFQRPECQVLGVRVIDDLVWGVAPGARIDVDRLLDRVGLAGMAARETSTLSGGQLQRLAVASLLARDPSVVISDESTAMLDPDGRVLLMGLLRSLAECENKAVVHITHHTEEIAGSHRTVNLGRTPAERAEPSPAPGRPSGGGGGGGVGGGAVSVQGLGFAHAAGTPWEHRVLRDVDLDLPAGGGLLITGVNGSGKSTLAALLSGISAPTEGQVLLDGRPVRNGRDGALLALQHSRLQLLRATVGEDVRDAASSSREAADAVLALLGLPPEVYGERGVDELSVGEQRRVALAGLLACRPRLLILDEPLAGLDQLGQCALVRALAAARATGTTLVVTSHDTAVLGDVVDGVVVVEHGRVRRSRPTVEAAASGRMVTPEPRPTASPATGPVGSGGPDRANPRWRGTRQGAAPVLGPRMLPWSSPAHRLWAGTRFYASLHRDGCTVDYPGTGLITPPADRGTLRSLPSLATLTDPSAIQEQLDRIQRAIIDDPVLAIGSAKELVESTAKVVLIERGRTVNEKDDLPALARAAQEALGLHPSSTTPGPDDSDAVKKILGAVSTIATGLGELRNRGYGTGHGPAAARVGLRARHAHLAVNAAVTWCQLLLDTLADTEAPWRKSP
jgi:energy-coupling factor transport system ATP-binding protein